MANERVVGKNPLLAAPYGRRSPDYSAAVVLFGIILAVAALTVCYHLA